MAQWVKRFASSCSGWVAFMSFWFDLCLNATPCDVFAAPYSFRLGDLTPFYKSVVVAWRELGGPFSASCSSLVFGSADPLFCVPVSSMTTRSCYLYFLSERIADPPCVEKFAPSFGPLYCPVVLRPFLFGPQSYRPELEDCPRCVLSRRASFFVWPSCPASVLLWCSC